MAAPKGIWSFPGIPAGSIIHGSMVEQHGITPGAASLYCTPFAGTPKTTGNLQLTYGTKKMLWKNCLLDSIHEELNDSGERIWVATILDRRWMWGHGDAKYGTISGWYNQRLQPDDPGFIPGTQRSPAQLVQLCLQALGETRWNTNALPNTPDTNPPVEWDYTPAAEAMQAILDLYGCRIFIDWNDTPMVVRLGVGRKLQGGESIVTAASATADPVERPPQIIIACAPTRFQVDLELEAVMEEPDGSFVGLPFSKLMPALKNGWSDVDPIDAEAMISIFPNLQYRKLVIKHLWKTYQVKVPINLPIAQWVGQGVVIRSLQRILPLLDTQLDRMPYTGPGTGKYFPQVVYGIFSDEHEINNNVVNVIDPSIIWDPATLTSSDLGGYYHKSFTVDRERGLVQFSDHVYRVGTKQIQVIEDEALPPPSIITRRTIHKVDAIFRDEAYLYLRTAIHLRDFVNNSIMRYERARNLPAPTLPVAPRYDKKDDLGANVIVRYAKPGPQLHNRPQGQPPPLNAPPPAQLKIASVVTNKQQVDANADRYLDAIQLEYRVLDPETRRYAGLFPIQLDGAIQQVTYWVDEEGFTRTQASYNCEAHEFAPPYREKRKLEQVKAQLQITQPVGQSAHEPTWTKPTRLRA